MGDKQKKKLTKKELKAQNHAKLLEMKKGKGAPAAPTFQAGQDQNKKAA